MYFNDYQTGSRKTAKYPAIGHPLIYLTLGYRRDMVYSEYTIFMKV